MTSKATTYPLHPLSPLSPEEITIAASLVRSSYPNAELQFKCITLREPEKAWVRQWINQERKTSATGINTRASDIGERKADIAFYIKNTAKFHEGIVNISARKVESVVRMPNDVHGPGDAEELGQIEQLVFEDESVKQELKKLQLPVGTIVVCDPWIYGSDGNNDTRRQFQCYLYMRDPSNPSEEDSCHYAFPLPLAPVIDTATQKVVRIDILPTGPGFSTDTAIKPYKPVPPNEYLPEHQNLRKDLKPLHVVQPEGASFQIKENGEVVSWQKWTFRVGFNYREGMVLYDVRYDGRDLFYRASLSDMSIPYADPRPPFHRKEAFDLGDVGAGNMANNLKLGCDCLGAIHYLDGTVANQKGEPVTMRNAICIHEQDNGILFKHTNYRTNRAVVARKRELVVQSIITAANYEYVFAFIFDQVGEMTYEVRATGVLSTQPIDEGESVAWGTVVHPGVLAGSHQHIFCLRVDPCVDGEGNAIVYEEAYPLPPDPKTNPYATGYVTAETKVEKSGGYMIEPLKNRVYKILNPAKLNPINKRPVGYKIMAPPFQPILANPTSFHHRRAEFADKNIYLTAYRDGELYAGGRWTNQSRGGTGVRSWANRNDSFTTPDGRPSTENSPVLWIQFGINHIPRIEDFPVMPVETVRVSLKPVNFFEKNPALDVPPSTQDVNKSVLLNGGDANGNGVDGVKDGSTAPGAHLQPSTQATVGSDGTIGDAQVVNGGGGCCGHN